MKKWIFFLLPFLFFCCPAQAHAAEYRAAEPPDPEEYILDESWTDFLQGQPFSYQELRDKSLGEAVALLADAFAAQLRRPLRLALRVSALLGLAAFFRVLFQESIPEGLGGMLQNGMAAAVFLQLCSPVMALLEDVRHTMEQCRVFLGQFIPVLCSVLAAAGQSGAAALYGGVFFSVMIGVSQLLYSFAVPMVRCFLALSVTAGVSGSLRLGGFVRLLRQLVHWIMGAAAAVFAGYLSLQSLLAGAADSLAMKAGKFVLSGGVPIVGGAVADAIGTVYAGLALVKKAVGAVGVAGLLVIFVPLLLRCAVYALLCRLCSAFAQALGSAPAGAMLDGLADGVQMLLALLVLDLLLIVMSVALAVLMRGG